MALNHLCQRRAGSGLQLREKLIEEGDGVVRAGGGLGMILDREYGELLVAQPLDGAVVQVHVRNLELRCTRDSLLIASDREAVVLRGDEHRSRLYFLHRVISAAMAVWKLDGGSPECEPQQLMPETDTEERHLCFS